MESYRDYCIENKFGAYPNREMCHFNGAFVFTHAYLQWVPVGNTSTGLASFCNDWLRCKSSVVTNPLQKRGKTMKNQQTRLYIFRWYHKAHGLGVGPMTAAGWENNWLSPKEHPKMTVLSWHPNIQWIIRIFPAKLTSIGIYHMFKQTHFVAWFVALLLPSSLASSQCRTFRTRFVVLNLHRPDNGGALDQAVEGPHSLWSSKLEDHCHSWIFTSSKRYVQWSLKNHRLLGFGGAIVSYFHCNPHIWRIDMATMLKSEHPIQLPCDGHIKMFRKLRQWCDKVDTDVLICMTSIIRSKR